MDVSIIIVNYNTELLILDCIKSIYEKTQYISFEIIVVDNASSNDHSILKTDSRIRYIQSETNLGFGKANNLGAKHAKGKYLFFLNPDTFLINNAIFILFQFIENNHDVGICGGNLYTKDLKPTHSHFTIAPGIKFELYNLFSGKTFLFKDVSYFNYSENPISVEYITGADLFIRKELFESINGFDKDFFMYFEESYLCFIAKQENSLVINVPQAHIIHLEGQSFSLKEKREMLYLQGRKLYLTKRYGFIYYEICNIIYFITCLTRLLLFHIHNDEIKTNYWRQKIRVFLKYIIRKDKNRQSR
ncbi:glycosyltransferase family 2 protein [Bacteroides sp. ET225]|uniref:glycosyltransferase family 2 protein n=1 Tax=Bacteroides sp. ET225 TaxID=2972461 RepID=UPI0021AD04F5|nr:glycosyltransferase family 2 protein [Bacteroides sp. ET225]MCR8916741.1 glycosyltransferase family 2 protein [Bacteroides sp. ET225]